MNKQKSYNNFLFLSTFTRGLSEVFSLVILYKKGYTIDNLFYYLMIMYLVGIIISTISLKISYKIVLLISSILYGISFIYLSYISKSLISLTILAIILGSSTYSYHIIRHFLALSMLDNKKRNPSKLIIITYLGNIISSIISIILIDKLPLIITSIIILCSTLISIIPILKAPIIPLKVNKDKVLIPKDKIIFSILEQAKVIFLELQPLYLYIYIDSSIYYVGIFNIITTISSLLVIIILSKLLRKNHFKYYTLILGLIFILKLNLSGSIILLLIAFLEGIFTKIYETFSLDNLYSYDNNNIINYLTKEELIFLTTKFIIILLVIILHLNIYHFMYLNIILIILSGIFIKEEKKT